MQVHILDTQMCVCVCVPSMDAVDSMLFTRTFKVSIVQSSLDDLFLRKFLIE